jgi:gliding motility-associated-like protein
MATTTYTFTPNVGQCATNATMTVSVNNLTTPTFNPIAPICVGDPLTLPANSNNGTPIAGTWSPAINNMATTTYTFTPNLGQCATNSTMTVGVNSNLTPTFTPLGTYCSGAVIPDLPTTSTNGITGDWSPAINNMVTTIYTFTPSLGLCATTTTLSIPVTLNITPTFESVGPYCSKVVIPDLPTISLNGITGNWIPAINNTKTTVYTFTPTDTTCYNKINKIITINENPVAGMIFSPQPTDMLNPNILFEDNSNEEVLTSEWHLGDGTIIYDELNFSHTYIDTGTYIIQYFITNQYDCSDSVIKNLIINPIYCTYIPSSFTPNDDGDNDYFYPSVVGGSHYNMKIYDRWGSVIYNEDNGKWDGILNNNLINSGVYPYFITVLDFKDTPFLYIGIITIN